MTLFMKKILTGMFAIVLFAGAAQAQDTTKLHHGHKEHPDMVKGKLDLTEAQKTQIKSINEARKVEVDKVDKMSLTADQRKEKMKAIHDKYQGQMELVLTPAQKDQLASMKGGHKKGAHPGDKHGDMKGKMESLNLSQDQKDKMSKMRESYKGQFESIRDNKSLTEDQKKEQMKALKMKQQDEMKMILTKEQLEKMQSFRTEHKDKSVK